MTSSAVRAVVAGHGDFADGVISAAAQITGRGEVFSGMSNRGLGPDEIERELRTRIDESGARVIFTDLPGGSATIAARRVLRDRPDLMLVTGANLAVLLDFACHEELDPGAAARHAAEKGRESVSVFGAPSAD